MTDITDENFMKKLDDNRELFDLDKDSLKVEEPATELVAWHGTEVFPNLVSQLEESLVGAELQ